MHEQDILHRKEPDCKDAKLWQVDIDGSNQQEIEGGITTDPHNLQSAKLSMTSGPFKS